MWHWVAPDDVRDVAVLEVLLVDRHSSPSVSRMLLGSLEQIPVSPHSHMRSGQAEPQVGAIMMHTQEDHGLMTYVPLACFSSRT